MTKNPIRRKKTLCRIRPKAKLSRVSGVYGSHHTTRCTCGGNGRDPLNGRRVHRACDGRGFLSA